MNTKIDGVTSITITTRASSVTPRDTEESKVKNLEPYISSNIPPDMLDLKPCLKSRKDIIATDRHVNVSTFNDTTIRSPRNIQRCRSSSLPTDIMQSQLAQFNKMPTKNKLPALNEEGKLCVEDPIISVSNPDVSALSTRRVSFILPDDSNTDLNRDGNSNLKTIYQNFLVVPGRTMHLGSELPTASDAFRQAMLSDDDVDSDESGNESGSTHSTDVESDNIFPDPNHVTSQGRKHTITSTPKKGSNKNMDSTDNRLMKRKNKNSEVHNRRDISPRTQRAEWTNVSVIR